MVCVGDQNMELLSRPVRWFARVAVVMFVLLLGFSLALSQRESRARGADLRNSHNLHGELVEIKPKIGNQERLPLYTGPGFFTVESAKFIEYELFPIKVEWVSIPLTEAKQIVLVHSSHPDFARAGNIQRTEHFALTGAQ